jgi:hypothetical protein
VIAVLQFRPSGDPTFEERAHAALTVLATRPGFVRGTLGRATDDESCWVLLIEWESVGAYRRALGAYDVKVIATPLLAQAIDHPSAFEALVTVSTDRSETVRASDRADDAEWTSRATGSER